MSIANILLRFSLPLLRPEVLQSLLAFLLGSVAWSKIANFPIEQEIVGGVVMTLVFWGISSFLHGSYKDWYETVTEEANQTHLIGATQSDVDLEAQPLNFPPMPDMFDIEYNPWNLP